MIPLLFGSRTRPVTGLFLPAEGRRVGRLAVICPPLGVEYLNAHRALRVLADRLAASGLDVLGFDWFGTGDSGGEHRDVTLRGAVDDVLAAVGEGLAVAGSAGNGVILVGHRHGTVAASIAAGAESRVAGLVLWDPVSPRTTAAEWRACPPAETPGTRWASGFAVAVSLIEELEAADTTVWSATDRLPSLTLASGPLPQGLRARAEREGWPGEVRSVPGPGPWEGSRELGVGAVPAPLLAEITRWCM